MIYPNSNAANIVWEKTSVQILTLHSGKDFVQDWSFRTRSAHNRLVVVKKKNL